MSCTHTTDCELYVQFAADPALNLWKKHFCEGDFGKCARYQLAQQGKPVPLTLLPNGKVLDQVRSQDDIALTALCNAIQKNRISMVQTMVRSKISSESVSNNEGRTPLMFAASLGRTEICEVLLNAGCDPHKQDQHGVTALMEAENNGHTECARLISEHMQHRQPAVQTTETQPQAPRKESLMSRVLGFMRSSTPNS